MSYDRYKWQKRKYFIRINCWIIIAILVVILCFMFPIVSDAAEVVPVPEGYTSVGSFLGIVEDDLYLNSNTNIDALPEGYINPLSWNVNDEFGYNMLDNDLSNGEILFLNSDLELTLYSTIPSYETFDISDFHYYFIDIAGQYHIPTLYLDNDFVGGVAPSINYSASGGVENRSYVYDSNFNVQGISFSFSSLLSGYDNVYVLSLNSQETSHYSSYTFGTYDSVNDHYSDLIVPASYGNNNCLWCTNIPNINTISPALRDGGDDLRVLDQNTLTYFSDILGSPNFAITHNYSNNNTFPDGSGGTDDNNLYMRTADWQFNIPKYWGSVTSTLVQSKYTQNWGSGNIIFYGLINDYQTANSDHFNLIFNFNIWCQGHHFSSVQSNIDENFHNTFKTSNIVVSLSDFVENNNTLSFNVSDIFDTAISPYNGVTCSDFISDIKTYESIDNWKWIITCDAFLSTVNQSDRSGDIVEEYNFISQVSSEKANTITDNRDPYYPENGLPNDDDSSSITNKDGSIILTNNDNDVININSNDKTVINTLVDKLVPADTSGETGLTQDFLELTNANNWFTVLNTALPILGVEFWNTIKIIFIAFLGIIGTAFALWIICHII